MTKNGFTACHISGGMASVLTKSRAKKLRLCPFWWNYNQKNTEMPNTAKRAYMRWRISLAMATRSSGV